MMQIALYQPDIPHNVGSMIRLAACFDAPLHIIEPCGFVLDERRIRRVAMDYTQHAKIVRHASWEAFKKALGTRHWGLDKESPSLPSVPNAQCLMPDPRLILLTTKATQSLYDFCFRPGDVLLLGRESSGVSAEVADACNARLLIPIQVAARSLNIAQAASIALGEAQRQVTMTETRMP